MKLENFTITYNVHVGPKKRVNDRQKHAIKRAILPFLLLRLISLKSFSGGMRWVRVLLTISRGKLNIPLLRDVPPTLS